MSLCAGGSDKQNLRENLQVYSDALFLTSTSCLQYKAVIRKFPWEMGRGQAAKVTTDFVKKVTSVSGPAYFVGEEEEAMDLENSNSVFLNLQFLISSS